MAQTIFGISAKLNEKVSKKQFLKETGFFLLVGIFAPSILLYFIDRNRVRFDGNNIYLDDELIIERK